MNQWKWAKFYIMVCHFSPSTHAGSCLAESYDRAISEIGCLLEFWNAWRPSVSPQHVLNVKLWYRVS